MVPELCFCQIITNFDEWSSNSDERSLKSGANWTNCNWFWQMVIDIRNKLVKAISSKHYFILTPIICHIGKMFSKIQPPPITIWHSFLCTVKLKKCSAKSNHLLILYHTLQKTSSQTKPRVWECVCKRKKDGLAFNIRRTVISELVV